MPAAQTTSDILTILIGIVLVVIIAVLAYFVIQWFLNRKKAFKDGWKDIYKELVSGGKTNMPDHMKQLLRVHIPFLGDFINKICDEKTREAALKELREIVDVYRKKGVPLGQITGYNCLDMTAAIEDMIIPQDADEDVMTDPKFKKQKEEIEKIFTECGRYIHVIVYKPKNKGLFSLQEDCLLCFSDQLLGLESQDGIVAVLGEGIDKLSYFSIPSGYPHRVKVVLTYLIGRGWMRGTIRTQAALVELLEDAIRLDPVTQKLLAARVMDNRGGKLEEGSK